jgi:hypothetical protein
MTLLKNVLYVTNGYAITFFVTEISEAGPYKLFYKGKLEGEQLSLIGEREDKEGSESGDRAEAGARFEGLLRDVPGVRVLEHDDRITRWSFYRYVLAIDPDAFAGHTNQAVCDALEAEGVGAWTGYEPMSNYDLFQPSLSRLPVAVEVIPLQKRLLVQAGDHVDLGGHSLHCVPSLWFWTSCIAMLASRCPQAAHLRYHIGRTTEEKRGLLREGSHPATQRVRPGR